MNKNSKEPDDNVVVRCPNCKRVVVVAANIPIVMDTKMHKEIGALVQAGQVVEHITTEAVRKEKFGCRCK